MSALRIPVCLVIIMLLLLTAASGCAPAAKKGPVPNSGHASAITADPPDSGGNGLVADEKPGVAGLKPYRLTMAFMATPPEDEALVERALNAYLTKKINATIDLRPIDWNQWSDKSNLMIASREPVDIFFTAAWANYAINASKGAFLGIGDLLASSGKGILRTLPPAFLAGSKINGKNYGIPSNKELAEQGGIIYRKDVADELGITDEIERARTPGDLEKALLTVKEKRPGMTPLFLRDGENFNSHYFADYDYLGDISVPGVILKDGDSARVRPRWAFPRYLQTLEITRKFMLEGLVNQDAATTQLSPQNALESGNVFMIPSSLKPGKAAEMAVAAGLGGNLAQVGMTPRTVSTGDTTGAMLAISSTSGDPARAMMFIDLLHTDRYVNNLLNFGIEGRHYVKLSDEVIAPGPYNSSYNMGVSWEFGNQFLNYIWDTEDPDKWNQLRAFNQDAHESPALGFTFDVDPVKTEVAAAVNVRKEFDPALDTGSVDPERVLPNYESKLKAAGLDRIIAEKQKQFDAYRADGR